MQLHLPLEHGRRWFLLHVLLVVVLWLLVIGAVFLFPGASLRFR
jgi:hypothetical protein